MSEIEAAMKNKVPEMAERESRNWFVFGKTGELEMSVSDCIQHVFEKKKIAFGASLNDLDHSSKVSVVKTSETSLLVFLQVSH